MPDYSIFSAEELREVLTPHVNNVEFFRLEQYTCMQNSLIKENWNGKNRRRIDFTDVIFDGANLDRAGFVGSTFTRCVFKKTTQMNGVNFSGCNFIDCSFENVTVFALFNDSKFVRTAFEECTIDDCNFENAHLESTMFSSCNITSANWESCNLNSATFDGCRLHLLNFEYAIWGNVHFNNTTIPFQTVPFIFGGPEYVLSTNDKVQFSSKLNAMPAKEYTEYLYAMMEFFVKTNNWFPAVNLSLAFGKARQAFDLLLHGTKELIHLRKFRTLHHLIALSNKSAGISTADKVHLFHELLPMLGTLEKDNTVDTFDKRMYISTLRSSVLPTEQGLHYVTLRTNIDTDNTEAVNALYELLENVATDILGVSHEIKISHNSPFVLDVSLALAPSIIGGAITLLNTVLSKHLNKKKSESDADKLKKSIQACRPDLSDTEVYKLVCNVLTYEPRLVDVSIQLVQTTLPPETTIRE